MTASSLPAEAGRLERAWAARLPLRLEIVAYAAVIAAGFGLRLWDLGSRALHHDESIHAKWAYDLLQGDYTHSPIFHGPFYYHFQASVFFVFGTNDYTSRLSAAFAGMGLVLLPLLLRRWLGPVGAFSAVAFLALSPTLVYYSRFLREDIYMAFFVLLIVAAMWRYVAEGRERWLILMAVGFVGGVTTKEGMFLTIAVFLLFLDLYVATELARTTMRNRAGLAAEDEELNRFELGWRTAALAPFSVPIVAFWPFLGRLRERMAWSELPRSGDLLVLMGTLTLPLLTPVLRDPLERIGFVEKDIILADGATTSRLDWDDHLLPAITTDDRWLLGGLFLLTTSSAAFVGLQWRARTWAICFGIVAGVYLTLMTTEWTNLDGLVSGPWGSIDYWREEQLEGYRGDQPWYYYYLLMPAYEFLPLTVALCGAFWAIFRGNAFSRFLVFWLVGQWLALSYGSEKMPWLNTHLAVPACILAAWTVNRAWLAARDTPRERLYPVLWATAGLAAGAMLFLVFLPHGTGYNVARLAVVALAAFAITFTATPLGRRAAGLVVVIALIGALSLFSLRTMVNASFERGDVPKDMLIYTQSSPQITEVMDDIEALAAATGKGKYLPIAVDGRDSFAWPWAWYLRDYKCVAYPDMSSGDPGRSFCEGVEQPYVVLLVNNASTGAVEQWIDENEAGSYGAPLEYPHRWWFPETYKDALKVGAFTSCTGKSGDCGPFRWATWSAIADNVVSGSWLRTWYRYWRDHDPDQISGRTGDRDCNSCGSVDGSAYFPPGYDFETNAYVVKPLEPPHPGVDAAGRATFGGRGSQDGNFARPVDIETDAAGNLYVIDSSRRRLQKFDAAGNVLASVDVRGAEGTDEESEPWGLAVLPDGRVVVADTFGWRIRVFDAALNLAAVYGETPKLEPGVEPGPLELFGPRDAAGHASGDIWVTDTGHDRIVVIGADGTAKQVIGGEGTEPGQFNEPVGISIQDVSGTIAISDVFNGRVVLLNPDGTYRGEFRVDGWTSAAEDKGYVETLRDGRIAVSMPELDEVRIYSREGELLATIAPTEEPLDRPYGMLETVDGKLWVVEGGAARVRQFALP